MKSSRRLSRLSIPDIRARKHGEPLACLTAYTAPMARILDPYVDILLVGDSLGMVIYGLENTLAVSLDMMIAHGRAVVRTTRQACIIVDMPFGSYQESPQIAFRAATKVMQETGCCGVKMEGGNYLSDTVAFLSERHIPVMGHIGLMPQDVRQSGGYKIRGQSPEDAARILEDARAIAKAGAFALVIEGVWENCARKVASQIDIPVIGIGASPACDGQILVSEDMLGLNRHFTPKFVKSYADLTKTIETAVSNYVCDIRAGRFPAPEHCFGTKATHDLKATPIHPKGRVTALKKRSTIRD